MVFESNSYSLIIFPEAGFNADERVGKIIYPPYKTRCIVLGDFLSLFLILYIVNKLILDYLKENLNEDGKPLITEYIEKESLHDIGHTCV